MQGIIPRAAVDVFKVVTSARDAEFRVSVSLLQVYMEVVSDLLTGVKTNLQIREVTGIALYLQSLTVLTAKKGSP